MEDPITVILARWCAELDRPPRTKIPGNTVVVLMISDIEGMLRRKLSPTAYCQKKDP